MLGLIDVGPTFTLEMLAKGTPPYKKTSDGACIVLALLLFSRLALSKRRIAVLLCAALISAAFLVRPSNYTPSIVDHAQPEARTPAAAVVPDMLAWNYSRQLESCKTDYRSRGMTTDRRDSKRTGYVLCLTYREQQTKAASSMYSLQCWAKTLLVNIVEPFLHDSRLIVPLDTSQSAMLAFSDLFNLRQWDILTTKLGFAPLAPWRKFLARAPREVVVVHLQYRAAATGGEKASHLAMSSAYKKGCALKSDFDQKLNYLTQYGFKVVREVCINFEHGDEITLLQFNTHVLGPYHPRNVSIVMDEWRGFSPTDNGKRVLINDGCWDRSSIRSSLYLQPSPRVYCEAHNYQKVYLGGSHNYVSVIVRTEKIFMNLLDLGKCLQKTQNLLETVKREMQLNSTFLSMDVGKYGSNSIASSLNEFDYSDFIGGIYGKGTSISTWEETFERVASTREAGYIALMQKVLVAEARCLVMAGGGSFQKHAILLHKIASKRRGQAPCVHILKSCSKNMNIDLSKL